jgi:hypothetical protein
MKLVILLLLVLAASTFAIEIIPTENTKYRSGTWMKPYRKSNNNTVGNGNVGYNIIAGNSFEGDNNILANSNHVNDSRIANDNRGNFNHDGNQNTGNNDTYANTIRGSFQERANHNFGNNNSIANLGGDGKPNPFSTVDEPSKKY